MSALPSISIVTISYNQAHYLEECLCSVIDERLDGLEYIVVDAGSNDGSRDIIALHADRIDVRILEPDDGPADGLNKGFAASHGEILGYINADDRFVPRALAFVRTFFANNPDVDVLCGAIRIVDRQGLHSLRARTADRFELARYAAGICTIGQQATFFRRRAFKKAGGFNPENRITWDGELLVDMALSGARFATVNRILGDFRVYGESITGSGLHRDAAKREHDRVREKIRSNGVRLPSRLTEGALRLAYRLNLRRHIDYLMARPATAEA
jgi:glycosyltransferase involved in cell wall biosynthesis